MRVPSLRGVSAHENRPGTPKDARPIADITPSRRGFADGDREGVVVNFRPLPCGQIIRTAADCEAFAGHLCTELVRRNPTVGPQGHLHSAQAANRRRRVGIEAMNRRLRTSHSCHVRTPSGIRRPAPHGTMPRGTTHLGHHTIAQPPAPINQIPRLGLTPKTGKCSISHTTSYPLQSQLS